MHLICMHCVLLNSKLYNISRRTFRNIYIILRALYVFHNNFYIINKFSVSNFQYVSLLRPPITESSAPGADIIDKVEWKQVSA